MERSATTEVAEVPLAGLPLRVLPLSASFLLLPGPKVSEVKQDVTPPPPITGSSVFTFSHVNSICVCGGIQAGTVVVDHELKAEPSTIPVWIPSLCTLGKGKGQGSLLAFHSLTSMRSSQPKSCSEKMVLLLPLEQILPFSRSWLL